MSGSGAELDSIVPGELYCASCEQTFSTGERCPKDGTRLVRLATQIDPFLGRDIDRKYTILEKLGQGGMGAVYRATQHSVGRDVAIKVVNPSLVSNTDVIKRFLREATLAGKLSHPHAVAVLEQGQTEDGLFYIVMELVKGRTLDQVIRSERVFKPERVVRIGTQICDALEGAHALSIVHRDLKPSNIILMSSGRDLVKVLDFGLAKSLAPDQTSSTMTGTGAVLGTPAFMPPELATGQPCDGRADLYSLGCVLYLLGSGRLPFSMESVHELVAAHAGEPAPPMTGVPAPLAAVIDRLLLKDPADRYQSAADTRQALEDALAAREPESAGWRLATTPSIGPFPATSEMFANMNETLATPPPAPARPMAAPPVAGRKPTSQTDLQRLVASDTLAVTPLPGAPVRAPIAALATPVPSAMPSLPAIQLADGDLMSIVPAATPSLAPRRRWGVIAGAGAVFALALVAFVATRGGSGSAAPAANGSDAPDTATQPTTQPTTQTQTQTLKTVAHDPPVTTPPVTTPPVTTPPVTTPPVTTPPVPTVAKTPPTTVPPHIIKHPPPVTPTQHPPTKPFDTTTKPVPTTHPVTPPTKLPF